MAQLYQSEDPTHPPRPQVRRLWTPTPEILWMLLPRCYDDYRELLEAESPEIVIVTTENVQHPASPAQT